VPELPELEALGERLEESFAGASLVGIEPLGFSALRSVDPPPGRLIGCTLRSVARVGKYLVWDYGSLRLVVHLSQGGRITIEDPPKRTRPKGGVVRLRFEDRPAILVREYGTERKAGWWVLTPGDEGPLARLGPDPYSEEFAALILHGDDTRRVHTLLRDQRTVAGIGRGYADDALLRARLSPFATLAKLSPTERRRLLDAVRSVLDEALATERERKGGLPPKLGDRFSAHNRAGTPCPVCGDGLRRISYESHEVTYCPRCQSGGKILADRRMSRFVK